MAVERDELMQMMIAGSGDSDHFPLNQREISFGNDEPAEQIIDSSSEEDHHISASFKQKMRGSEYNQTKGSSFYQ